MSGGLGSAVAEVLCDEGARPRKFKRLALPDEYVSLVGGHEWLVDQFGLSAPHIVKAVKGMVKGRLAASEPGQRCHEKL
jgi:transketolase C-terminal domain/subunit